MVTTCDQQEQSVAINLDFRSVELYFRIRDKQVRHGRDPLWILAS